MKIPETLVSMMHILFKNKINEICDKYLMDYGKLLDHQISFNGSVKVVLKIDLKGEIQPLNVELTDLHVEKDIDNYYLRINKIKMDKEWMQKLGQDYLNGKFTDPRLKLNYQIGFLLIKFLK